MLQNDFYHKISNNEGANDKLWQTDGCTDTATYHNTVYIPFIDMHIEVDIYQPLWFNHVSNNDKSHTLRQSEINRVV